MKPKKISQVYATDAVLLDPLIEEVDRQIVDDQCWMGLCEVVELPIVHANDLPDLDMSQLLFVTLYGPVPVFPGHFGQVFGRVFMVPVYPVVLYPGDLGWYRITGLEHRYDEIFARAEVFDALHVNASIGRRH